MIPTRERILRCNGNWSKYTLKFNFEPEKKSLEKVIPFWKPSFSGSMLDFGGVDERWWKHGTDTWPRLHAFWLASVFSVSCDVSWHRKDGQRYVFVVGRFTVFPIVVSQHVSKQPPKPFSGHVFLQRHGMTLFWASSDISWNWWGRFKLHLESVLSYITLSTVSLLIYI